MQDGYRSFPPLNYKDLDPSDGPVVVHFVIDKELITLQHTSLQRQFFNETGVIRLGGSGTANIGDGSPMARSGDQKSVYGTRNKFGCVIGKSNGGDQVLYYWDSAQKTIIKTNQSGRVDLALEKNFKAWIEQNSTWIFDKDNPLGGQGIVGLGIISGERRPC